MTDGKPFHQTGYSLVDHPVLQHLVGISHTFEISDGRAFVKIDTVGLYEFANRLITQTLAKVAHGHPVAADVIANEAVESERDRIMFHVLDELDGLKELGQIGDRLKRIVRGTNPMGTSVSHMFDKGTAEFVRKPGIPNKLGHHPSALVRALAARIVELEAIVDPKDRS